MLTAKKIHNKTSKANINRYPKLEKQNHTPVPIVEIKDEDESPQTCISSIYFPYIKRGNCNRLLPNYSTVLGRTAKVGVFVEDLDQLQHDLEKLLSFASVRNRLLRQQVKQTSTAKKEHLDKGSKKRKLVDEPSSSATLKRIQLELKRKLRLSKAGRRFIRGKHRGKGKGLSALPGVCSLGNDTSIRQPRVFIPRNDMSEKFWSTVDPYCLDITRDDTYFLEGLIKDCSTPTTVQIPEIGTHYALEWADQKLSLEKHYSEMAKQRTKFLPIFTNLQQRGSKIISQHLDILYDSSLSERLSAALTESSPTKTDNKPETVTSVTAMNEQNGQKDLNGTRAGLCLEHRLRRDLLPDAENQGPGQAANAPDDIVLEIRRCCRELNTVNRNNIVELKKLHAKCVRDFKRQSFKLALNKVDAQVLDLYSDIMKTKKEHAATFTRPNLQPFEKKASVIRKQQIALYKSYSSPLVKREAIIESDDSSVD